MRLKKSWIVLLFLLLRLKSSAQTIVTDIRRSEMETMAEKKDQEPDDDSYELDLDEFNRHPLNINLAAEEEFIPLYMLNVMQVRNLISYRKLLGPLLSLRELQAVPGLDIETIHKLLPYIIVTADETLYTAVRNRWTGGDASFLIRAGQVLEKSKGFEKPVKPDAACYTGSAQKVFIRYAYNNKQLLSFGFSGEKDAGEPFLRGAQRWGFDFYSFHFFLHRAGYIRALAVGDFTVNMGQGLIQWQTTSFTKSGQAMAIKREADCLRPYRSAGEFNFHRGIGINLQKGRWQSTLFLSSQAVSSNRELDTVLREDRFSSFQNSGYHRTPAEIEDRNNTRQFSAGANIRYTHNQFMAGFNFIHFQFSRLFQKRNEPYNIYSLKGNRLSDCSLDYHYTLGNLHLFGELASDQWRHLAWVQGALLSLGENLDMSFLYRNISAAFQSLYSDAFTENTIPNNEKGFYTGLSFRPAPGLQADIYYDLFVFPWLKYGTDRPSDGRDVMIQLNYQPNKAWLITTLYKNERKSVNAATAFSATHGLRLPVKQRFHIGTTYTLSRSVSFNSRMELIWLEEKGVYPQHGFLGLAGMAVRKTSWSGNIAIAVFDTDGYDTRIYAYEPDLLYSFSLPLYYGRGIHYYIDLHQDFGKRMNGNRKRIHLSGWLKWGQTFYPGSVSVGSGLDEIAGDRKTEIKAQVLVQW